MSLSFDLVLVSIWLVSSRIVNQLHRIEDILQAQQRTEESV